MRAPEVQIIGICEQQWLPIMTEDKTRAEEQSPSAVRLCCAAELKGHLSTASILVLTIELSGIRGIRSICVLCE